MLKPESNFQAHIHFQALDEFSQLHSYMNSPKPIKKGHSHKPAEEILLSLAWLTWYKDKAKAKLSELTSILG